MKKLVRLLESGEKTAFVNSKAVEYRDEKELQDLRDNPDIKSISTAQGKKIKEEVGRKYTAEESAAVGKTVGKSLVKVLRGQGDEVVDIRLTGVGLNKFDIKVKYGNDKGQDLFKFTLNPDQESITIDLGSQGKEELVDFIITQGNTVSLPTPELEDKLSVIMKKYITEPVPDLPQPEEVLPETTKHVGDKYVNYPEKGGKRLGTFATKSAAQKQLTAIEINKHKNETLDPVGKEDDDINNDGKVNSTDKYLSKRRQNISKNIGEDLDLGHEDDEPGMLLGDLYSIMKSTKELYEMVSQFEGQGEVDFPHWWQAKIIKAKSCLSAAQQYLDFEVNKPQQQVVVATLGEAKGTCCHKCGHVHVKGTPHPTPYLTGQKNCKFKD